MRCLLFRLKYGEGGDGEQTFWTDVGQSDASGLNEVQGFGDILGFLNAHPRVSIISAQSCIPLNV